MLFHDVFSLHSFLSLEGGLKVCKSYLWTQRVNISPEACRWSHLPHWACGWSCFMMEVSAVAVVWEGSSCGISAARPGLSCSTPGPVASLPPAHQLMGTQLGRGRLMTVWMPSDNIFPKLQCLPVLLPSVTQWKPQISSSPLHGYPQVSSVTPHSTITLVSLLDGLHPCKIISSIFYFSQKES